MAREHLGQWVLELPVFPGQPGFEVWQQCRSPVAWISLRDRNPPPLPFGTSFLLPEQRDVVVLEERATEISGLEDSAPEVVRELPRYDLGGHRRHLAIGPRKTDEQRPLGPVEEVTDRFLPDVRGRDRRCLEKCRVDDGCEKPPSRVACSAGSRHQAGEGLSDLEDLRGGVPDVRSARHPTVDHHAEVLRGVSERDKLSIELDLNVRTPFPSVEKDSVGRCSSASNRTLRIAIPVEWWDLNPYWFGDSVPIVRSSEQRRK